MSAVQGSVAGSAAARLRGLTQSQLDVLIIASTLLLSLLLRLPFLNVPLITDEGGYAYAAQRWFSGQGELYKDLYFDRPQGIFLIYGLIQNTLGTDLIAIRLGAWIANALTLILVWLIARDIGGRRAAALAIVCFALITGSPAIEGFTANAEVFMALPSAACVYVLLRASRARWDWRLVLAAGLLAGMATLIKQSGVILIPVAFAFAGLSLSNRLKELFRTLPAFMLGFLIAVVPAFIHGWLVGWESFITAVGGRVGSHSAASIPMREQLQAISKLMPHVLIPLTLVIMIWALRLRRVETGKRITFRSTNLPAGNRLSLPRLLPGAEGAVLLRLWTLGSLLGIAMGGNWFPHYVTQLAAPLAIWLAVETVPLGRHFPRIVYHSILVLIVISLLTPYGLIIKTRGDVDAISTEVFTRTTYGTQDDVAAYVRSTTTEDDSIYVAFFQASIYYLAERPAAYKHLYLWELRANPMAEDELIAMVTSETRPAVIVSVPLLSPFPNQSERFWSAVNANYHYETTVGEMAIYRANSDSY